MSRNTDKIEKALTEKGYQVNELFWEPIGGAPIMCGNEGGWYIDFEPMANKEFPDKFFNSSPILAYNINEVMEEIEKLPICTDCTG